MRMRMHISSYTCHMHMSMPCPCARHAHATAASPPRTISQILNPLLPVALVAGQSVAARRLAASGVFCVDPKRIAICGKIKVAAFDKTGTLTKDGLDFAGVLVAAPDSSEEGEGGGGAGWAAPLMPFAPAACAPELLAALASCHSVSLLADDLVGLQLEVEILRATGWSLTEPHGAPPFVRGAAADGSQRVAILRRCEFDHVSMTMSVVARLADGGLRCFCKGAPEALAKRCALTLRTARLAIGHTYLGLPSGARAGVTRSLQPPVPSLRPFWNRCNHPATPPPTPPTVHPALPSLHHPLLPPHPTPPTHPPPGATRRHCPPTTLPSLRRTRCRAITSSASPPRT